MTPSTSDVDTSLDLINAEEGMEFGVQSVINCADQSRVSEQECLALLEFYDDNNLSYGIDTDVCLWEWVLCNNWFITYLKQKNSNVSNLSALSRINNLYSLILRDNDIYNINPLKWLINLTYLDLVNNNISDINSLNQLTNLDTLYISRNNINDINNLSPLTNLRNLDLDMNNISNIQPITWLIKLENLNLRLNEISNISPLSGLKNLKELHLDVNNISNISPLSGLKNLKELRLEVNNISDINPLSNLTSLLRMYIGHNNISNVTPINKLPNLQRLYISNNSICDISPLVWNTYERIHLINNYLPTEEDHYDAATRSWLQSYRAPGTQGDGEGICGAVCGDGKIQWDEQCDDGNEQSWDGCSAACLTETPNCVEQACAYVVDEDNTMKDCRIWDKMNTCLQEEEDPRYEEPDFGGEIGVPNTKSCGNGICEPRLWETRQVCPSDCPRPLE